MKYRYTLDSGSSKFICPKCEKKRFVRYKDTLTGEYLSEQFGRCDRESNCGYHLHPYSQGFGYKSKGRFKGESKITSKQKTKISLFPIPHKILTATLKDYDKNQFVQNLLNNVPFPIDSLSMEKVISQYYVGTINRGYGRGRGSMLRYATTFPFIDRFQNVRAIQAKQFDSFNHTTWTEYVHSIVGSRYTRDKKPIPEWVEKYKKNESKVTCLFGEHLLDKYPYNPIALVEAPKTAIIGTLYFGFPDNPKNLLWLAVGSVSYLNYERCRELSGRDIYLFPDLSMSGTAYQKWNEKAIELKRYMPNSRFTVSDLLERLACKKERFKGSDLADYLIQLDWLTF